MEPAIGQRPDTFERHAERAGDTDLLTMGHRSTMSENYLMLTRDDTRAVFRQNTSSHASQLSIIVFADDKNILWTLSVSLKIFDSS